MSSPRSKHSEDGLNLILFNIPQSILLQLSTGPVLIALLASQAAGALQNIGQASEEIFRGDRLPVLEFPVETETESG
jgi:hypothetical protein